MVCNLKHVRGFEGEGTLTMRGLPPGVSTAPVTITPGQSEAIFTLSATNDAPLGRHGGLFCEFSAQVNGVASIHRLAGGGVVRIDAKPVEVAKAPPAPKPEAPKETKPAPPKPLSRLEQLRRDAEQRRSAAATPAAEEKTKQP